MFCVCMFCLPVSVCTTRVSGTPETGIRSLELRLSTVSCCVGTESGFSERETSALSLQLPLYLTLYSIYLSISYSEV